MNQSSSVAVLVLVWAVAFAPPCGRACPKLPERDPVAPFTLAPGARAAVVQYFTASQNADAARAASLIDYDEWTRQLGLDRDAAKRWAEAHRADLRTDYRREKAAGSSKEYRIVKEAVRDGSGVFEVAQKRVSGVYRWEVTVGIKRGRWLVTGFELLSIER